MYKVLEVSDVDSAIWTELEAIAAPIFKNASALIEFTKFNNSHCVLARKGDGTLLGCNFFKAATNASEPHFMGLVMCAPDAPQLQPFLQIRNLRRLLKHQPHGNGWCWGRTADPIILDFLTKIFPETYPTSNIDSHETKAEEIRSSILASRGWKSGCHPFHLPGSASHSYSIAHSDVVKHRRNSRYQELFDYLGFNIDRGDRILTISRI